MKKQKLLTLFAALLMLLGVQSVNAVTLQVVDGTNGGSIAKLVDGDNGTKWEGGFGSGQFVILKNAANLPVIPANYTIVTGNDNERWTGRGWKAWKIYGANFAFDAAAERESADWVLLDQKSNITQDIVPDVNSKPFDFNFSEAVTKGYVYFKIEVLELQGAGYMQMCEFILNGCTVDVSFSDVLNSYDPTGSDADLVNAYAAGKAALAAASTQEETEAAMATLSALRQEMETIKSGRFVALSWAAGAWGDGPGSNLVDKKESTKWGGNFQGSDPQYVIFRGQSMQPFFYKLVTGNDTATSTGRNWKTWKVFGGNFASEAEATKDAEGWVVLDDRQDVTEEYLPMKNFYPATFNFNLGVSTAYTYYKVEVYAPHNGNQHQMSEMYLCTQEEFEASRAPYVAEFEEFAAGVGDLVVEPALEDDKETFATLFEELKTTADAVRLTKINNQLTQMREALTESAAFLAGGYRALDGNVGSATSGEGFAKLLDGTSSTKWCGTIPEGGAYVIFKKYADTGLAQYMMITGNDTGNGGGARNWKSWKIYGASFASDLDATRDATDWTLIDQKDNIGQDLLPAANFAPAYFNFSETWSGYTHFKIELESCYNGTLQQMAEFKMLSDEAYAAERQAMIDELTTAATTVLAGAGIEVPATLMQKLMAATPVAALMNAPASELLPKYNAALNFINTGLLALAATAVPAQADGIYQIANAMQLVYFAEKVNSGEADADAVLVADIDLADVSPYEWSAIGTPDVAYSGSFDGQGHAITNFEGTTPVATGKFGLFGNVNEATIENFSIAGSLTVPAGAFNGSGVVGWAENSTISNIYSTLVIEVGGDDARHVAGVLGSAQKGANTITNCTFAGSITVAAGSHDCFAGIVGYMSADKIENCVNLGTIDFYDKGCNAGGITGYINNEGPTVANCLNVGAVTYRGEGTPTYSGAIVGRLRKDVPNIKNNYWLEGSAVASCGEKALASPAVTSVTAEQLASGEVAYLLNGKTSDGDLAWFQTLDEPKVYLAEQYVATINGSQKAPRTADVTLSENGDGTYTFMLTDLVISVMGQELTVGDISLDGVVVNDDGTFSKEGTYDVPDENIPSEYDMLKLYFKNLPYTLSGKVNNDKLYAVIDITLNIVVTGTTYAINVEAGVDDFEAVAPALTSDLYPVLDATHGIVYPVGQVHCDGTPYEDVTYSNKPAESTQDDHNFVDGYCTYCGACIMTPTEDGIYEISTAEELVMFAQIVNKGAYDADAILTADIDMTDADITKFPIGSITDATAGRYVVTFDGQFHKLSNFKLVNPSAPKNYGMFNTTTGVVLKNFWLDSSCEIEGTEVVSLIGRHDGGGTFECIGNFANVTGKNNNIGGLFGGVFGNSSSIKQVTITDCFSAGKVTSTNTSVTNHLDCGALSGWFNNVNVTLTNFWTIAEVVNYRDEARYIIRSGNGATFTADNCYSLYYAENLTKATFSPVTEEQVQSGELTYMLGSVWRQTIGTDQTPVLDPAHGIVNKITEAGYATQYIADTDVTIPEGVQAFTGEIESTRLKLNALDGVIAAGEPVVLKGAAGFYSFIPTTGATKVEGNVLKGTDEEIPAEGLYVLAKPDEASPIGFYLADSGTIKAGKAYLEDASGVKAFFFEGDEATGIANVGNAVEDGLIYNLAGQRVGKMQKGINIVNGKKVLY